MNEAIRKIEECMISLNYYSNIDDVRRVLYVFNNAKSDDELYPFNLTAIATKIYSNIKDDTLYRDTELR